MELKTYLFVNKIGDRRFFSVVDAFTSKRAEEKIVELTKESGQPMYEWEYLKIENGHPMFLKEREAIFEIVDLEADYQKEAIAHA